MAQRTEKEETEFKVPETLTLCINNCGVTGNPATNNMCQNCFNATTATSSSSPSTIGAPSSGGASILKFSAEQSSRSTPSRSPVNRSASASPTTASTTSSPIFASNLSGNDPAAAAEKKSVNRCSGCRKRVGLTGFRCRCGELFCAEHRYSDRHDCSFDYKTAGREAIARENPVVKAAKIIRV